MTYNVSSGTLSLYTTTYEGVMNERFVAVSTVTGFYDTWLLF